MPEPTDDREMPAHLRGKPVGYDVRAMALEVEPADDGETEDAPMRIAISSEEPYQRTDWWTGETYLEVLDHRAEGVDLSYTVDGMPFCLDHDLSRMVGLVEGAAVGGDRKMRGALRQGNHPDAAWAFADMRGGIRKKISVGYIRGTFEPVTLPDGREARLYRWMPYEASSVPVPADYTVGVGRSAVGAAPISESIPPEQPEGAKESTMPETVNDAPDAGAKAERERIVALRDLGKKYQMAERSVDWIADGMTVDAAKDEILAKQATAAPTVFSRSPDGPIGRDGQVKPEFETAGEFFKAVAVASIPGNRADPRLAQRAISGNSEGTAVDGGFAVTKPVAMAVTESLWTTGQILPRVNRIPVTGNGIKLVRVDETSRADGSRGGAVTAEWTQEGGKPTAGKIKLREHNLDLKKLTALGYATEELLEDTQALEAEMVRAFRDELLFKAEDSIINGTGNGQPLGILNAGCLVSQAIEGSQTIANSATYIAANVAKMKARVPAGLWAGLTWIINPSHYATLLTSSIGNTPMLVRGASLSGAQPIDMLLGNPVIWSEYPAAVGAVGDIVLANLGQYDVAEKSVGPNFATSAHLRFDYGDMTYRFVYRIDGQPGWRSAVTPFKGSDTKSPFVTLAVRS